MNLLSSSVHSSLTHIAQKKKEIKKMKNKNKKLAFLL